MSDAPKRRVVMTADIQADSMEELVSHLFNVAQQLERGEMVRGSVSGGSSSGHVINIRDDGMTTHESYIRALNAYLGKK